MKRSTLRLIITLIGIILVFSKVPMNAVSASVWVNNEDGTMTCFDDDGRVVANTWITENNQTYYLRSNGKTAVNCVLKIEGDKYCFDEGGVMLTSTWKSMDGQTYYFRANGKMARNCSLKIKGKTYKFASDGELITKSKSAVTRPFNGLEWGMKKTSVVKALKLKKNDYSIKDGLMVCAPLTSAKYEKAYFYLFDSDEKLVGYGEISDNSDEALSYFKSELLDNGWSNELNKKENGCKYRYYGKESEIAVIVESDDEIMAIVFKSENLEF